MASSPQESVGPEVVAEDKTLVEKLRDSLTAKQCFDNFLFCLVTIMLIVDLVTDLWVVTIYGARKDTVFMAVSSLFLILTGLLCAIMFATNMRTDTEGRMAKMYVCLCCNFPFQIGIIYQRCLYGAQRCSRQAVVHAHARPVGIGSSSSAMDWRFAKLKLLQSMFQCAPELIINLLHILTFMDVHVVQYVSAATSLFSLVLGVVLHEKARKDHARGATMGISKVVCIFAYKSLILATRVFALANFIYFFKGWIVTLILPHLLLMFSFFSFLYRQIWKVPYHKIVQHSLYSLLAYFPVHNEYRPEGEIVAFYILFMVENIVMVAIPFRYSFPGSVNPVHEPGSKYYLAMTLSVLVGSAVGLIFMALYYFVFHKSRHTIRDTNLGWLARICEWSKASREAAGDPDLPDHAHRGRPGASRDPDKIYISQDGNDNQGEEEDAGEDCVRDPESGMIRNSAELPDREYQPGMGTDPDTDTTSRATLLNHNVLKPANQDVGLRIFKGRREAVMKEMAEQCLGEGPGCASRPSVLEGEDEDEDEDHDEGDRKPLHPVV